MKASKLKDVRKGEYFTLKPVELKPDEETPSRLVLVRGDYDIDSKKYEIYKFDNCNQYNFAKGDRIVYTDIYF